MSIITDISVSEIESDSGSSASFKMSLFTEQRGDIKTKILTEVEVLDRKKQRRRKVSSDRNSDKTRRKLKREKGSEADSRRSSLKTLTDKSDNEGSNSDKLGSEQAKLSKSDREHLRKPDSEHPTPGKLAKSDDEQTKLAKSVSETAVPDSLVRRDELAGEGADSPITDHIKNSEKQDGSGSQEDSIEEEVSFEELISEEGDEIERPGSDGKHEVDEEVWCLLWSTVFS